MQNPSRLSALMLLAAASPLVPGARGYAQSTNRSLIRLAAAPAPDSSDTVAVGRGNKVTLPFSNVTRVITEDDEVARAFFTNGKATIEGVGDGDTTVEVYQGTETPTLLSVQVQDASANGSDQSTGAAPLSSSVLSATPSDSLPPITAPIAPARSPLAISLNVTPALDNPTQAVFTVTYSNSSTDPAQGVIVRFTLDDAVSYVTDSASSGGTYDASQRQVVWNLGTVPAGVAAQKLVLRVEPIERNAVTYEEVASIEDSSGSSIVSNQVRYSTAATPLLTVFAIPDRFLAGRSGPVLVDVKGMEFQSAVDRLQSLGIVSGRHPGYFCPDQPTQRAEYAVMTLNGLNLRDLRDVTQIKYVLGRRSTVDLSIMDSNGRTVIDLVKDGIFDAGEHTAVWNGRIGAGFADPGRYTYVCLARDVTGNTTTLKGNLTIVPQTPLESSGVPSFVDVKPTDWYAADLAVGEKQGLLYGYADKTFRPTQSISRVEATAIVVRALGLEDLAKQWADKDVGFLDYQNIDPWARGYVNVASTVAKTMDGRPLMRGRPSNFFEPNKDLRRDEAALIVERLIDRDTTRHVSISGAVVPGATVSINSSPVDADENGRFSFNIDSNSTQPTTVAVIDARDR